MKILTLIRKTAWGFWLGAGMAVMGHPYTSPEFWVFCIPLIILIVINYD